MSIATEVAAAVVSALKTQKFSIPFEPELSVLPSYEPAELTTLRVSVVPLSIEIERVSRSSSRYTVAVDIGIQKRIENSPKETVAAIGSLADEINEFLKDNTLEEYPAAQWNGVSNDPLYVPEHLSQKRVFTSVLSVKYILFG